MNKARRAMLQKAIEAIDEARALIEECRELEQEAFDNMPESIQCSERGEQMENYIYSMDEMIDTTCDMQESLEEIING